MFKKSEQINELALALSKFQGEVTDATKDSQAYGYRYAQLSGVLEIARPLLAKHGLAITQGCDSDIETHYYENENKTPDISTAVRIDTLLMHTSGQWLSSEISCLVAPMKGATQVQSAGSIITYLRRYSLAAILGITQVDDDGNPDLQQVHNTPAKPKLTPTHLQLIDMVKDLKISDDEQKTWLEKVKVKGLEDLTQLHAAKLIAMLNSRIANKTNAKEGETNHAV